eukprot:scaffold758_cov387-Pavlova_lutheri.AAC.5
MGDELPPEEHLNLNITTTLECCDSLTLPCSYSTMAMLCKHTAHSNTPFKVVLRRAKTKVAKESLTLNAKHGFYLVVRIAICPIHRTMKVLLSYM